MREGVMDNSKLQALPIVTLASSKYVGTHTPSESPFFTGLDLSSNPISLRIRGGLEPLWDDTNFTFDYTKVPDSVVGSAFLIKRDVVELYGIAKSTHSDTNPAVMGSKYISVAVWCYKKTTTKATLYELAFQINSKGQTLFIPYVTADVKTSVFLSTLYAKTQSVRVDVVGSSVDTNKFPTFYISVNIEGTNAFKDDATAGRVIYQPLIQIVLDDVTAIASATLVEDNKLPRGVAIKGLNDTSEYPTPIRMFYANNRTWICNGVADSNLTFPNNSVPVLVFDNTISLSGTAKNAPKTLFLGRYDENISDLFGYDGSTFVVTNRAIYKIDTAQQTQDTFIVNEIVSDIYAYRGSALKVGNSMYVPCVNGIYTLNMRQQNIQIENLANRISDPVFELVNGMVCVDSCYNATNNTVSFLYTILPTQKPGIDKIYSSLGVTDMPKSIVLSKKLGVDDGWFSNLYEYYFNGISSVMITADQVSSVFGDANIPSYTGARGSDYIEEVVLSGTDGSYIHSRGRQTDFVKDADNPFNVIIGFPVSSIDTFQGYSELKRTSITSLKMWIDVNDNAGTLIDQTSKGFIKSSFVDSTRLVTEDNYSENLEYNTQITIASNGLINLSVNKHGFSGTVYVLFSSLYFNRLIAYKLETKQSIN
jgi:hypothetical protein